MKERTLNFTITGQFLTDMAREYVLDGDSQGAINFLREVLSGIDLDTVVEILIGNEKLVGNSDDGVYLEYEESDTKDAYVEQLNQTFAGILKVGRKFYQPYAIVKSFGEKDIQYHFNLLGEFPETDSIGKRRALYYADNEDDKVYVLDSGEKPDMPVLFCEVDLPFFISPFKDSQEAFNDFMKKRPGSLEERGFMETYGGCAEVCVDEEKQEVKPEENEEYEEKTVKFEDKINEPEIDQEENFRRLVIEQANSQENGWLSLPIPKNYLEYDYVEEDMSEEDIEYIQVPYAPFKRWALSTIGYPPTIPEWKNIAPPNFKMFGDNQDHTDWILGAGIKLDDWIMKREYPRLDAIDRAAFSKLVEFGEEFE